MPGAVPVLDGLNAHCPRGSGHAARAAQGRAVRQGVQRFGPGAQHGLVHLADLRLAAAVLAGQHHRHVLVRARGAPRRVLALRAALGRVLQAAVAAPAGLEVLAVAAAPGAGSAQVLGAGVHRCLGHGGAGVVELVNRVLERERPEAALLVPRRVQWPPDLGSALGGALGVPQLFDVGHLSDGELAARQAQRHVVHHGSSVTVSCVRVLQVHERDATSVGQDTYLLILI